MCHILDIYYPSMYHSDIFINIHWEKSNCFAVKVSLTFKFTSTTPGSSMYRTCADTICIARAMTSNAGRQPNKMAPTTRCSRTPPATSFQLTYGKRAVVRNNLDVVRNILDVLFVLSYSVSNSLHDVYIQKCSRSDS